MYAVVESGGKQYRVEPGTVLVVDRLNAEEGETVTLRPVLVSDGELVTDPAKLDKIRIEATVTGHERGRKVHVLKYKAKKGYRRRSGHRSDLTRIEVTSLGGTKKAAAKKTAAKKATPAKATEEQAAPEEKAEKKAAPKKAAPKKAAPKKAAPKKAAPKADAEKADADSKNEAEAAENVKEQSDGS